LTFNPPKLVIRRGQTVEWQNQSNQLHNVVDDATKATNKADVRLPAGVPPFGSGLLRPGQNYSHRFTVRGTYRYVCTLHEAQGMKFEIVVK
jgi:plastocyanin